MADNFNPINLYPAKDQTDTKDNNETEFGTNKSDHVYLRNTIDGIPILTMDNYSLWRKRFLRMLDLQGLTDAVTQPKGVLSDKQLTSALTTKMSGELENNIASWDIETDARKIWEAVTEHFASTQPANKARIHQELRAIVFDINDVQQFITEIKVVLTHMHEVGIMITETTATTSWQKRITHSDKELTTELIFKHLNQFANDQKTLLSTPGHLKTSRVPQTLLNTFTDPNMRCKKGAHNSLSTNHPYDNCWFAFPKLRPAFPPRPETTVSTSFHSFIAPSDSSFVLDSGASAHMVANKNLFFALQIKEEGLVRTSSGSDSLKIMGSGSIKVSNKDGDLVFHNVLFIPDLVVNLLSVRSLVILNYNVQFHKNSFSISKDNKLVIDGRYVGNLPVIQFLNSEHYSHLSSLELLHKSVGHVSCRRLRNKLGIPLKITNDCESCAVSKITRASFQNKHCHASRPFEELHLDLIGPINPASREGDKFILTIVDSNTRFVSAIPIRSKGDVLETLSVLLDFEAKRFGYYPSVLHSDHGTEFITRTMKEYCMQHRIRSRTSDAYTPQQNGLAERFNRTVIESLRSIIHDSGVAKKDWNEIVKAACLTLNQFPSHKSAPLPFEQFKNQSIDLSYFHPIGNRVSYLILPKQSGAKLSPKGKLGTLIGYNDEIRSYSIITSTGAILDTKHVKFLDFEKPDLATQDDEDLEVFEHLDKTLTAPAEVDTEVKIIEDSSPSPQIDIVSDSGSEQEEDTVEEEPVEGESSDEEDEVSESLVPQPSTGRTLRI
ncbi:hypothetical protein PSHT_12684 [Puccinia striiformis]|uniref:Integrase catalytic domain-containing protein n=1 Tax=Puccinia striiformis TaxID=27350 RepID=A0A2S4UUY1_9BASI|nr:hypothetical protein PSHT_12684 [Puccinia striiformis]